MTKHPFGFAKPAAVLSATLTATLPLAGPLQAESTLPEAGERIPGSDIALEARLSTAYSLNQYLNPFDLEVEVDKGRATLRGSVPSQVQRWLAGRLARDMGIASIDNQLKIAAVMGDTTPSELYRLVADTNTTTRVQLRLLWQRETSGQAIRVSTSDGNVRLHGRADSEQARHSAAQLAELTDGVRAVENDIEVGTPESSASSAPMADLTLDQSDQGIAERLRETLRFDRRTSAQTIDTRVREGTAILEGTVTSETQRSQAASIAQGLVGVSDVDNRLKVASQS